MIKYVNGITLNSQKIAILKCPKLILVTQKDATRKDRQICKLKQLFRCKFLSLLKCCLSSQHAKISLTFLLRYLASQKLGFTYQINLALNSRNLRLTKTMNLHILTIGKVCIPLLQPSKYVLAPTLNIFSRGRFFHAVVFNPFFEHC